jgi:hypothetical protein
VCGGILIVEEAAGEHHQAAHLLVLRRDAEHHGVLGDAAAHADAVVVLQHGRVGDNRGADRSTTAMHVFAGHVVGRGGVVRPDNAAAAVLHLDLVRAEAGDRLDGVLLAR